MAPWREAGCEGKSDVFALGMTIYETVCRWYPFDGDDQDAILAKLNTQFQLPVGSSGIGGGSSVDTGHKGLMPSVNFDQLFVISCVTDIRNVVAQLLGGAKSRCKCVGEKETSRKIANRFTLDSRQPSHASSLAFCLRGGTTTLEKRTP